VTAFAFANCAGEILYATPYTGEIPQVIDWIDDADPYTRKRGLRLIALAHRYGMNIFCYPSDVEAMITLIEPVRLHGIEVADWN